MKTPAFSKDAELAVPQIKSSSNRKKHTRRSSPIKQAKGAKTTHKKDIKGVVSEDKQKMCAASKKGAVTAKIQTGIIPTKKVISAKSESIKKAGTVIKAADRTCIWTY